EMSTAVKWAAKQPESSPMATADDRNHSMSDSAASDDLSKPTAPARPSDLPALMSPGAATALAVAVCFVGVAILLIRQTKATRMAVVAAVKTAPVPVAPRPLLVPEAPKGEASADSDLAKAEA